MVTKSKMPKIIMLMWMDGDVVVKHIVVHLKSLKDQASSFYQKGHQARLYNLKTIICKGMSLRLNKQLLK